MPTRQASQVGLVIPISTPSLSLPDVQISTFFSHSR